MVGSHEALDLSYWSLSKPGSDFQMPMCKIYKWNAFYVAYIQKRMPKIVLSLGFLLPSGTS